MKDWQCKNCGYQMDGVLNCKPDLCPVCGNADFENAEVAEEREAENRAVNEHDDYLEELRNEM